MFAVFEIICTFAQGREKSLPFKIVKEWDLN